MRRSFAWLLIAPLALALACGEEAGPGPAPPAEKAAPTAPPAATPPPSAPQPAAGFVAAPELPPTLERGLLVALSVFEQGEAGPIPRSQLVLLRRRDGRWQATEHEDPTSNVFHKALVYTPPGAEPGILTLGGTDARVRLWRATGNGLEAETLWEEDFGGDFSRMRDAEVADLDADGEPEIAVATHDQGVVAVIDPQPDGWAVRRLDEQPEIIVHEIEIGDLDGDDVLEVYATPSEPNRLDGTEQHGEVIRFVPAGEGDDASRTLVADLGSRHAKEILVEDVDGDGSDELYVSIEAAEGGQTEIRRYDASDPASGGVTIATLPDSMCRFLTAGDVDGDGAKEMIAAAKDSGLWLLRPGDDARARWEKTRVDADSAGFEHAALLTDLDGDGRDELYVASDRDNEIRRYVWTEAGIAREVIHERSAASPLFTWNLESFPADLVP